jgi:hypothetical protein
MRHLAGAVPSSPDDKVCFFQAGGMVSVCGPLSAVTALPGSISPTTSARPRKSAPYWLRQSGRAPRSCDPRLVRCGGGTTGAFADPDGYVWEVAHNPGWTLGEEWSVKI